MPKSDTWPGGTGLETMTGMDSAGSCDSVISANSGVVSNSTFSLGVSATAYLIKQSDMMTKTCLPIVCKC